MPHLLSGSIVQKLFMHLCNLFPEIFVPTSQVLFVTFTNLVTKQHQKFEETIEQNMTYLAGTRNQLRRRKKKRYPNVETPPTDHRLDPRKSCLELWGISQISVSERPRCHV